MLGFITNFWVGDTENQVLRNQKPASSTERFISGKGNNSLKYLSAAYY